MDSTLEVRLDKWLWSVRLYRTRTLAAAACTSGKVLIGGQHVKPARSVRIGEVISAVTGDMTRTVKVVALLENRVGAKLVSEYYEDLTPASEYARPREKFAPVFGFRAPGKGRPTKRDRRQISGLLEGL